MAGIVTNDVVVSFKKSTTWGTAVAVSSGFRLYCSQVALGGGFEEFLSRDIGFSKLMTDTTRLTADFTISITCDLTYAQPWEAILAQIMGTESSPVETTGGQGDYTRNIDMATSIHSTASPAAAMFSMAWTIENATYIIELPSVKFFSFTISAEANKVGTITFQGIPNRPITTGWTSTYANVTSNAGLTYENAVLGGTNAYFRMNANSGGAFSGSDDKPIEMYSITVNRPLRPQHVLQGANSPYIIEPKDVDRVDGRISVRLQEINISTLDILALWANKTAQKAELFFDGTQIASGVNRSFKFQFPKLLAMPSFPQGYDIPNNNSLMTPTIEFRMVKASSAPTGMTGVTDYLRVVPIDTRSSKWTA